MKHSGASIDAALLHMPGLAGCLVPQQCSLAEQNFLMVDEATQRLKLAGLRLQDGCRWRIDAGV